MSDYAARLQSLIDSATDKDAVKTSIGARLYDNSTMSGKPMPTSSKDSEIDAIIGEFEGDAEMSGEVSEALGMEGGRKKRKAKKTRKSKKSRKTPKKTRKYSRRR